MHLRFYCVLSLLLVSLFQFRCLTDHQLPPDTQPPFNPITEPVRGLWIPATDTDALTSRATIARTLDECVAYNINYIFVVVWTRGYTLYPSDLMQRTFNIRIDPRFVGRDPLQEVITEARQRNIKVYAWFEYGFAADFQAGNAHILTQKPGWAARSADGSITTKNGFRWMNALLPDVQDFMTALVKEVVTNYAVDGIQGDDRLPALPSEAGYDETTVARYKQEHNNQAPPNVATNPGWVSWRANILNDYLRRLVVEVKKTRPGCRVAMAPSVFPFSRDQYLQDWPTWVRNDWVDLISPQVYRRDLASYQGELNKITGGQVPANKLSLVAPGILLKSGSYVAPEQLLRQQIDANRQAGIQSEIYFHYEGTKTRKSFFEQVYK